MSKLTPAGSSTRENQLERARSQCPLITYAAEQRRTDPTWAYVDSIQKLSLQSLQRRPFAYSLRRLVWQYYEFKRWLQRKGVFKTVCWYGLLFDFAVPACSHPPSKRRLRKQLKQAGLSAAEIKGIVG